MPATAPSEDLTAVRAALQAYIACWNAGQPSRLKDHWDASQPNPIYVAEEAEAFTTWPEIEAYWAALNGIDVKVTIGELQLSHITADLIAAIYPMHWRIRFENHDHWKNPIGGNLRVSALLARCGAQWKLVHYVEAPYAAAVQLKKWLELDAGR